MNKKLPFSHAFYFFFTHISLAERPKALDGPRMGLVCIPNPPKKPTEHAEAAFLGNDCNHTVQEVDPHGETSCSIKNKEFFFTHKFTLKNLAYFLLAQLVIVFFIFFVFFRLSCICINIFFQNSHKILLALDFTLFYYQPPWSPGGHFRYHLGIYLKISLLRHPVSTAGRRRKKTSSEYAHLLTKKPKIWHPSRRANFHVCTSARLHRYE